MAARDKLCGNNLVALKDLDLGVWIDRPKFSDVDCEDKRWIGAPDPIDDLNKSRRTYVIEGLTNWFDPCADADTYSPLALAWYVLAWHLQCGYLVVLLVHFIAKEKAIRAREMSVQPAAVDTDPAGVIILQDRVETAAALSYADSLEDASR